MANTFSCLNVHCVFSTKGRFAVLTPDVRERLWPYMGGIAKQNGIFPKCVGVSQIPETIQYIEQQQEHHRTRTFKEEYFAFLKKHGANLEEKYLWD